MSQRDVLYLPLGVTLLMVLYLSVSWIRIWLDKRTTKQMETTYKLSEAEYPVTLTAGYEIALKIDEKEVYFRRDENNDVVLCFGGLSTKANEHNCTIGNTKFSVRTIDGKLVFGCVPQDKFEIITVN